MKPALVIAALLVFQSASVAQSGGELSGRVVDSDGRAIDGITVTYKRLQRQIVDSNGRVRLAGPALSASVVTARDGSFSIKEAAGNYIVCALPLRQPQIGSCEWPLVTSRVQIVEGRVSPLSDLVVRTGTRVVLAFSDSSGRLRNNRSFLVGVMSSTGYYQRAHLDSSLSKEGIPAYVAIIPATTTAQVFVASTGMKLTYKDGRAVITGRPDLRIETGKPGSDVVVEMSIQ